MTYVILGDINWLNMVILRVLDYPTFYLEELFNYKSIKNETH